MCKPGGAHQLSLRQLPLPVVWQLLTLSKGTAATNRKDSPIRDEKLSFSFFMEGVLHTVHYSATHFIEYIDPDSDPDV